MITFNQKTVADFDLTLEEVGQFAETKPGMLFIDAEGMIYAYMYYNCFLAMDPGAPTDAAQFFIDMGDENDSANYGWTQVRRVNGDAKLVVTINEVL